MKKKISVRRLGDIGKNGRCTDDTIMTIPVTEKLLNKDILATITGSITKAIWLMGEMRQKFISLLGKPVKEVLNAGRIFSFGANISIIGYMQKR